MVLLRPSNIQYILWIAFYCTYTSSQPLLQRIQKIFVDEGVIFVDGVILQRIQKIFVDEGVTEFT